MGYLKIIRANTTSLKYVFSLSTVRGDVLNKRSINRDIESKLSGMRKRPPQHTESKHFCQQRRRQLRSPRTVGGRALPEVLPVSSTSPFRTCMILYRSYSQSHRGPSMSHSAHNECQTDSYLRENAPGFALAPGVSFDPMAGRGISPRDILDSFRRCATPVHAPKYQVFVARLRTRASVKLKISPKKQSPRGQPPLCLGMFGSAWMCSRFAQGACTTRPLPHLLRRCTRSGLQIASGQSERRLDFTCHPCKPRTILL